jgi:hypothetical protein
MRYYRIVPIALVLIAAAGPALAARMPDMTPHYPIEHQTASAMGDGTQQPYAMNESDEAAQALGVTGGRWEAFDTGSSSSLMPSLKGGVDSGGAMLRLQWHPGE